MNMIVPVALLRPVLDELLAKGRLATPPRPWLGIYAMEGDGGLMVGGVAERGPAAAAGVQQGDRIIGIGEEETPDLGGFWRRLWASGPAGANVLLRLQRDGRAMSLSITTADRGSFLRAPRLH